MSSAQSNPPDASISISSGSATVVGPGRTYMVGDTVTAFSTDTGASFVCTVTGISATGGITSVTVPGNSATPADGTYGLSEGSANVRDLRDSSDYTRQLKERLLYNEFQTQVGNAKLDRRGNISSAGPGSAGTLWEQQSNQVRLSYLYGKQKCTYCPGVGFVTNGVRNFNSSGVQRGS